MDETDLRVEREQMRPVRRTSCVRGHMLMVNATGLVVCEVDRGMWVACDLGDWRVCPRCGGELERSGL